MLIDINKIVVGERIRKDFGDIQELADNIKKNGLLNPITINNRHVLLAGERRLRACKLLGWSQVDVRMVESEDEAQDIEIELSENTVRRNFTGSELAEGIRRQMAIESEKARERQEASRFGNDGGANIGTTAGKARDKAAEHFGISGEQARKTLYVSDNADLLDPAEFADWDEGKLSTNKAFQRIKAKLQQAESERDDARETVSMAQRMSDVLKSQRDRAQSDLASAKEEIAALEKQNDELYEMANNQQVVEREIVKTVAPDDYEDIKKRVRELEGSNRLYVDDNKSLREQLENARTGTRDHDKLLEEAKIEAAVFWGKYASLDELVDVFSAISQLMNN